MCMIMFGGGGESGCGSCKNIPAIATSRKRDEARESNGGSGIDIQFNEIGAIPGVVTTVSVPPACPTPLRTCCCRNQRTRDVEDSVAVLE